MPCSRSLMAANMGFQANFPNTNHAMPNAMVIQNIKPMAGVTKLIVLLFFLFWLMYLFWFYKKFVNAIF
jgi:hypothetical protein